MAAPRKRNDWFRPGECRRLIYDVLRDADRPLTTREVAGAVMAAKAMAIDDARTCELIYKAVHSSLKRANDTTKCVEMAGAAVWQVI
jgi:phosphohistidine phosphatase SixA